MENPQVTNMVILLKNSSKRTYFTRYPKLKSDILITLTTPVGLILFQDVVVENLRNEGLTVKTLLINPKDRLSGKEWIPRLSSINIYLGKSFFTNHVLKNSESFESFNSIYPLIIRRINEETKSYFKIIDSNPDNPNNIIMSVFYRTEDNFIFQFLFRLDKHNENDDSLNKILEVIIRYEITKNQKLVSQVKNTITQKSKILYFEFQNDKWDIIDPMVRLCKQFNNQYRKDKDKRIRKPLVYVHRDNFGKKSKSDTNWVLSSEKLETMMIRPNEVSIFLNISDIYWNKGEIFLKDKLLPRIKHQYGRFPSVTEQKDYYNYFENMMISLIFSYTSIESFVNICIPSDYKKRVKKKNKWLWISKNQIEKEFGLPDKLSSILTEVLMTPNPKKEKWWLTFSKLKEIRDEIVHTKQSLSEEMYSQFLSERIFEVIRVNKQIIQYYGRYIDMNKRELLDDYPYDMGFDEFIPVFRNEMFFEKLWKSSHNPRP